MPDKREKVGVRRKTCIRDDQRTLAEPGGDDAEGMPLPGAEKQFARRSQCAEKIHSVSPPIIQAASSAIS
ncbi:hypothetical protein D3C80_1597690 [compost metagenome]